VGLACVVFLFGLPSKGQDRDPAPHEHFHDFYKDWKQPGSVLSCCNANEYADESQEHHIKGDCEPTEAKLVDGHWIARLPKYKGGGWIPIPDDKIIREINPEPSTAHLCVNSNNSVLCFVPPFGGF
jgi:hypothetical protein